jgi:cell division protein FtsZ
MADDGDDGELLLGDSMMADEGAEEAAPEEPAAGTRSWLTGPDSAPAAPKREGGTLFERMSNIARGAAKAQVEEEPAPARGSRDPLDIPRFLNRQNNQ